MQRRFDVVFGGNTNSGPVGDTWAWDGTDWTDVTPPTSSPTARYEAAMAYDAGRGRIVLFGGADNTTTFGDTWEWDGAAWTEVTPATSPSPRLDAVMTYDPARRRVVLFGGFTTANMADTWEWDGTAWTQLAPVSAAPARGRSVAAYDATRAAVVLFAGNAGGAELNDLWTYRYTTPDADDELCDGNDGDHDGLLGCDDPDCWAYCTPSCPPGTSCDPAAPHCGDGVCNPDLESTICPADCH